MSKLIDITGQKFNSLLVLERDENNGKKVMWKCQCDCGNITSVYGVYLRNGHTKSCGCQRKKVAKKIGSKNKKDLKGQKFGLLTVLEDEGDREGNHVKWTCKCECGNITKVLATNLLSGNVKSCGCLKSSYGEYCIEKILKKNNISYCKEYTIKELNNARFDFAIIENNKIIRLIEFDGEHHFEEVSFHKDNKYSLKERQEKDKIKNEWAAAHNIPLVRIPYWERDNITLEMILGDEYLVE